MVEYNKILIEGGEKVIEQFSDKIKGLLRKKPLTKEEEKYKRVTGEFMAGKPIQLNIPDDAVNPWKEEQIVSDPQ